MGRGGDGERGGWGEGEKELFLLSPCPHARRPLSPLSPQSLSYSKDFIKGG
ncbi:MAG: hypothetical protein KME31_30135 [Tolypothrix carrinoi HA7290-LM1]|nr:hypothetical protein [Tolypothrix carrinoi HA7290-LM1]